ncbi:TetR/AcrR family transcriptional regulator [Pseudonocardia spinosispora]|uniref:TetR/AcrR family transcriptional regulator n=1 Tax=Pseudonocardia spinosispora TaxID=103441 RepID=UPI00048EEC8F|nr:TetR family transcriptional regulator [Pseudonocardia spinosispora]
MTDGRLLRGQARRAQLLEAAVRVAERDGVAALTHRAVGKEAGVAATAGTYYFPTMNDLLAAVLTACTEEFAASARTGLCSIDELAVCLAHYLSADELGRTTTSYEAYLLAARRPELRPAVKLWLTTLEEVLRTWTSDDTAIAAALAACDGLLLQGLITEHPPTADQFAAVLHLILD